MKADSVAAKNSAKNTCKVFHVYNPITSTTVPHRLPLNKETESLPNTILYEEYDALQKKYGAPV